VEAGRAGIFHGSPPAGLDPKVIDPIIDFDTTEASDHAAPSLDPSTDVEFDPAAALMSLNLGYTPDIHDGYSPSLDPSTGPGLDQSLDPNPDLRIGPSLDPSVDGPMSMPDEPVDWSDGADTYGTQGAS
jgi:hypothetical protein